MIKLFLKGGKMYNLVYLIGRLTTDPETTETETGKKVMTINLAVQRSFKNSDGIYETDFIRCVLWDGIASRTSEFCRKGDLIGVRGQIRTSSYETENGEKKYQTEVVVEKVSFLSSKPIEEEKPNSGKK
jgi:single-strand DNA-binding protein